MELGDRISVVDRLGMAGLPLLVQALELPFLDADRLPQGLALEFVLDNGPLRSGEHRGVEALLLRRLAALIVWLVLLRHWHLGRRGLCRRQISDGLSGALAELLPLCRRRLLRLGVSIWDGSGSVC